MPDHAPLMPLSVSESPEQKFREFLEIRGEKLTEPRRVLVRHIFDTHKHFDADELVADLTAPAVGSAARRSIAPSACWWKPACCGSFASPIEAPTNTITATPRMTTCIAPNAIRWSNSATTRFAGFANPSVWNMAFAPRGTGL